MTEFLAIISEAARQPQVQVWFLVGIIAGSIFGLYFRKNAGPPMVSALVFLALLLPARFLTPPTWFTIIYAVVFMLTGFIGFCAGWLSGLLLGHVWGLVLDRAKRQAASRPPHDD
ncbi:hypothetical protein QCM77_40590 [Bradyrhizobium sp. SSUT18]|uniref:hypothetical protein n=1 Tax=unclassified Bradyrhizobium TaxID=2631580 RepID=UPI0024484070|nr:MULTISPECIES: hypothetical protein [unclassified Bradyrhizobium]MDH2347033.1 hypothetical protein [Bradyrhizobium sp. SSUT77]MDH2357756.1 hypothetical protein [Bradyrhizobium sp. SSUT112]MDH2406132.1 hypothetical protein [Bradyrhizobium sp. SSUT18]